MIITALADGISNQKELLSEHGFSLWIENGKTKILFDAGAGANFIKNAEYLNINLAGLHAAVLSHNHYDHTGGLKFLGDAVSKKTSFVAGENFFQVKFKKTNGDYKRISGGAITEENIKKTFNIKVVKSVLNITPELSAVRLNKASSIIKDYFYVKREDGVFYPDDFSEETVLVRQENKNLTVITGCSHMGIKNIVNTAEFYFPGYKIKNLIGGFHLENAEEEYFLSVIDLIKKYGFKIYCGHCTGVEKMERLKEKFGGLVEILHTGRVIKV